MNVNRATGYTKTELPKSSICYLLIAGLVDLGVAFMPAWSLVAESNLLDHTVQSFRVVVKETVNQPRELVAIFWLPFGVGTVCLVATLASLFGSYESRSRRAIIFIPLAITAGVLIYFFVTRADIHIMAISLLPLSVAWWKYRKSLDNK